MVAGDKEVFPRFRSIHSVIGICVRYWYVCDGVSYNKKSANIDVQSYPDGSPGHNLLAVLAVDGISKISYTGR